MKKELVNIVLWHLKELNQSKKRIQKNNLMQQRNRQKVNKNNKKIMKMMRLSN